MPSSAVYHLVTSCKITGTSVPVNQSTSQPVNQSTSQPVNMLAFVKAQQSENVPEQRFQIDALVDSLAVAIEEESSLDERIKGRKLFLIEQLRLATISPYGRRYSPSLAYALMRENSSSSLYKQMLKANVLSLPPAQPVKDHLHGHRTNWQHPLLHGCVNESYFRTRAACSPPHRRDLYRPASGVPVRKSIWIREAAI